MTKEEIIGLVREAASKTVDYDLMGNPITDADVMLMGAFGPLVLRVAALVAAAEREACAKVCDAGAINSPSEGGRNRAEICANAIRARSRQ